MKTESRPTHAGQVPDLSSPDGGLAAGDHPSTAAGRHWRQFTTSSALLIEIPLALALIAAALLATLPGTAWD